jgi:hypothetical protein
MLLLLGACGMLDIAFFSSLPRTTYFLMANMNYCCKATHMRSSRQFDENISLGTSSRHYILKVFLFDDAVGNSKIIVYLQKSPRRDSRIDDPEYRVTCSYDNIRRINTQKQALSTQRTLSCNATTHLPHYKPSIHSTVLEETSVRNAAQSCHIQRVAQ